MARREWSCQRCHVVLGRITADRLGRDHLRLYAARISAVQPSVASSAVITCLCGMRRTFRGYEVHIEGDRDEAA